MLVWEHAELAEPEVYVHGLHRYIGTCPKCLVGLKRLATVDTTRARIRKFAIN